MDLIHQAEQYVSDLYNNSLPEVYTYHNLQHTKGVTEAVKTICRQEQMSHEDTEKLLLAAWFHDTGYIKRPEGHEMHSVEEFKKWAEGKLDTSYVNAISELILATRFEYVPKNKLEAIAKDSDYYHFAETNYPDFSDRLRLELKTVLGMQFTDLEWAQENLKMLDNKHVYHTSFANEFWKPLKQENSNRLRNTIEKMTSTNNDSNSHPKTPKEKEPKAVRGVDSMFKITLTNHTRLSEIADSKANILLSVNAIIISIALSTLVPKLDSPTNAHLILPTFIMVLFSVISIVFAILSTRPKVTSGTFTMQDVADKKVNLLFFGNFYKMPYEQYEAAVNQLMNDKDYLYNSMIKDLYYLGLVLERKYRLLRITYNIFMFGIITSVVAFAVAFKTSGY